MERIAVLVDPNPGMRVVAHVSGNSVNILHCPFCGSGAVIGRSDGTIECGYCTSVFTVQVQPAYNGFPQSVDGNAYPWPGAPDPADVIGATPPAGTNLAPGVNDPAAMGGDPTMGGAPVPPDSSDPADAEGADEDDEDSDDSDNPFAKKKDSGKKDDKKSKGKNPFAKGSSYMAVNGAELPVDEFLAHIAIRTATDPARVAQRVSEARKRGDL